MQKSLNKIGIDSNNLYLITLYVKHINFYEFNYFIDFILEMK